MARRKAPQNKAQPGAPENKEPFIKDEKKEPSEETGSDELTDLVVCDTQLRRLLKAEHNEWVGTISRQDLRKIADRIRDEINGNAEFEEDSNGA